MRPSANADDWPFQDPRNVAVFTTRAILELGQPVLLVAHDDDDGSWQFHTGEPEPAEKDGRIVGLAEMIEIDRTLVEVADLPLGWQAYRDWPGGAWRRSPS